MTDTPHKNPESSTISDTPETDAEHERICEAFCHGSNDYYKMFEFAKKLERERDEARFDLSFSRDLYKLHEFQSDELRKQLAEVTKKYTLLKKLHDAASVDRRNSVSESVRLVELNHELTKERDEAISSCHIWQKGHSALVSDRDGWKKLAVEQEKQIAKQLTILQEHGLAEYGN